MTIKRDAATGWNEHTGEPRWRASDAALARVREAQITWLTTPHARVAHLVVDGGGGAPVAVLRHVPAHRRWTMRMEGFSFWDHNRILGHAHFKEVQGFDRVADARRLVETVLRQAGATITERRR